MTTKKDIKARKKVLDEQVDKYDEMTRIYENDNVAVYLTAHKGNGRKTFTYTSSVHWTHEAASVRRYMRGANSYEVDISYGSGGVISDDPEQVAEAMEAIFKHAKQIAKSLKQIKVN